MTELQSEPRRRSPATARYAEKKQAIVAAASEILNRDGVKGMTLANVASRVGLITTSVTYYFKKKEDLAVACFLDGIARFDELIDRRSADPTGRTHACCALLELWLDLHRRIAAGEAPADRVVQRHPRLAEAAARRRARSVHALLRQGARACS